MTGAFTYTNVLAWAVSVAAVLQRRTGWATTVEDPSLQTDGSYKVGLTAEFEPGVAWTQLLYAVDDGVNNWDEMREQLVEKLEFFGKSMIVVHSVMPAVEKRLRERPGWSVLIEHQALRGVTPRMPHVFQFHVEIDWQAALAANYFPAPTPIEIRDEVRPKFTIRETSYPLMTEYDLGFNCGDEWLLGTPEDVLIRWFEERVVTHVHGAISREGDEVNG